MAQIGRISGPLLFANLERQGTDLAFRNDLHTTQLLYLDVDTGRIAVNNDAAAVDLDISGRLRTVDLLSNQTGSARLANFEISNTTISAISGDINLSASQAIVASAIETTDFKIDDNKITTTAADTDIELRPNGSGLVEIQNNTEVLGNIHASGNVSFDGTITFGDNVSQDTVDFNSDIDSDINPNTTDTFSLGNNSKKWNDLYVNLINGQSVETQDIAAGGTVLNSRPGNIFYVASNGTDTNVGDHIQGPLASIKEALSRADASTAGPVVIHVMPGIYQENFPLEVPASVSVIGHDLRNVIVKPTISTNTNDAFHLNGETTIEKITVRDFYYDSVNNTGHAFRFAPGAVTSTRSPYIKDVTVITQGTTTSTDDPRGFNSDDAGRGAYINGAEMDSSSAESSMLFHSATFITPGVDAITMTNGVRVEWLNSFIYFADRGLYAKNGLIGRTSPDGSTLNYGAEIRSVSSANIYGNFGAVADGSDCLMYLIQHNMAYIGAAESVENDPSLANQQNEVTEVNGGQIHFVTTDHTGAFRVGDNFFVDFETGSTSVDTTTLTADTVTGLVIVTGADTTTLDGRFIDTGNIRIADNTIQTLADDFDIASASNTINLEKNTRVQGSVDIAGNFTFDGSISFAGNEPGDAVTFNVDLEQDFNPNETQSFDLGSPSKAWLAAYLNGLEAGDISVIDNTISTSTSNADLELRANSSGLVRIDGTGEIAQNLTVSQASNFADVDVTGSLDLEGQTTISASASVGQNMFVSGNLSTGARAQFENIEAQGNSLSTTQSNSNLELRAAGTGVVGVDTDLETNQSLSFADGDIGNSAVISTSSSASSASIADFYIDDNFVQVTAVNEDLSLLSQNKISVAANDARLDRNLAVSGTTDLSDTSLNGSLQHLGNRTQIGDYALAGTLSIDQIIFEDNFIAVSQADTDLTISAAGDVLLESATIVEHDLTTQGGSDLRSVDILADLEHTGARNQSGNYSVLGDAVIDEILVRDNYFTSISQDQDLILSAAGTGKLVGSLDSLDIANDFTAQGNANLRLTHITGPIQHTGNKTQTGNVSISNNAVIQGNLSVSSALQTEDISVFGNKIATLSSNSNLKLQAAGTGTTIFKDSVVVSKDLFAAKITSGDILIDQDLDLNEIVIPPSVIEIDDNFISTTVSNADLELKANGSGEVAALENVEIQSDITVEGSTLLGNTNIPAAITQTGNTTKTGNYNLLGNVNIVGAANFTTKAEIDNFEIEGNSLRSQSGDVVLKASGTGSIDFSDLAVSADVSSSSLVTNDIIIDATFSLEELESSTDVQIFDNVVTTSNSNSNLELRASSAGSVNLQQLLFNTDSISTDQDNIVISPLENIVINATGGLKLPIGTDDEIIEEQIEILDGGTALANGSFLSGGDATTVFTASDVIFNAGEAVVVLTGAPGSVRFNSDAQRFEGFAGGRITFGGVFSDDKQTSVTADENTDTIRFAVNNSETATIDSTALFAPRISVEDVTIDNATVTTAVSNSDLEIRSQTSAEVLIDDLSFNSNKIKTNSSGLLIRASEDGYAKIDSSTGAVIPSGTIAQRPLEDPELGDTRFNTDDEILEVWDGSTYVAAAGTSATISEEEFNDLIFEYTLIFG